MNDDWEMSSAFIFSAMFELFFVVDWTTWEKLRGNSCGSNIRIESVSEVWIKFISRLMIWISISHKNETVDNELSCMTVVWTFFIQSNVRNK